VSRAEAIGAIRALKLFLGVPNSAEKGHPFRVISVRYEFPVHCHGRGRGFESRRPRHSKQAFGFEW
jgi:hypothetical protein